MKSDNHLRILLVEGNSRQVLPMAQSLKELGNHVTTLNTSKFDFGQTSKHPHEKLILYREDADKDTKYDAIKNLLENNFYDLVIPMNDDAAILLSKHKSELSKHTSIAVNNWDVIQYSIDKQKTMDICMKNNLPCPKTVIDESEFERKIAFFKFPVVVKPRTGCGAVGFHISNDLDNLREYYAHGKSKYGPCLVQEYIPQTDLQYKAELYIDNNDNVKSAVVFAKVRWYPINGGSSTLNKTVERPDIIETCVKLLKTIGWKGYADVDLIQDPRDGIAKVIEINPRITGSVKICFKAGVNFSQQIVEDYLGKEVTPMFDYKKDVYLRYLQKDVLWFIKSPNRFKCKPSWFSFKDTVDQIFSWKDPMPFIYSSLSSFSKLNKDRKKRKTN